MSTSLKFSIGPLVGIICAFLLNLPTIKLYIQSEYLNLVPLLFLLMLFFISDSKYGYIKKVKTYLCALIFFYTLVIFSGVFNSQYFDFFYLSKYLNIMLVFPLVAILFNYSSIKYYIWANVAWGAIVAVLYSVNLVDMTKINYLQVGHPISCTLLSCFIILFSKVKYTTKLVILGFSTVCFLSLLSLYGRSPLIFPMLIFFVYLSVGFIKNNLFLGLSIISVLIYSIILYFDLLISSLPYHLRGRVENFPDIISDEPRIITWKQALDLIMDSPFGYGAESSVGLLGYVPHNFILESGLSIGLLGIIISSYFMITTLREVVHGFSSSNLSLKLIAGYAMYYVMRYQVGGSIGSSYDFFCTSLILILSIFIIKGKSRDINCHSNTQ